MNSRIRQSLFNFSGVPGWPKWFWQAVLVLWTIVTAGISGAFLALFLMNSKEGVYTSALFPIIFIAFVALILFSNRAYSTAPIIILVGSLFLPFYVNTGTESVIVDSLLLTMMFTGLWLIRILLTRSRTILAPSEINFPVVGFTITVLASLLWGILFRDPHVFVWDDFLIVQLGSTAVFVMLPIALLLTANHLQEIKEIRWMVGLTLIASMLGIISKLSGFSLPVNTRGILSMWFVAFALALALFNTRLSWPVRLGLAVLAGLWIFDGFGLNINWIAGWLPVFIAIGILTLLKSWRAFAIFALAIVLLIGPNQEFYLGSFIQVEAEESLYTRLDAFQVNWEITREHLLLGTGPAGYTPYYMTYFPNRAMATHNNFIDILSQLGLIGMGFFVWFGVVLLLKGFRVVRSLHRSGTFEESFAKAAFAGSIGALAIMLFGDWLLPFAYTQTIAGFDYIVPTWLFMGALVALERIRSNTSPQS